MVGVFALILTQLLIDENSQSRFQFIREKRRKKSLNYIEDSKRGSF